MVWVIAFGELFFGDLWCVVWGYGGMRTHFSLLNPQTPPLSFGVTSIHALQLGTSEDRPAVLGAQQSGECVPDGAINLQFTGGTPACAVP